MKDVRVTLNLTAPLKWAVKAASIVVSPLVMLEKHMAQETIKAAMSTQAGRDALLQAILAGKAGQEEA